MNILIKNQNAKILDSINIDIIKTLEGEYDKTTINYELSGFIFNKVIIDITAVKNYYDVNELLSFLDFFEKEQVILLLNNSEFVNSINYLKNLVNNGYYNFTKNGAGIAYLIEHPNSINEVQKYITEVKTEPKNTLGFENNQYNNPNVGHDSVKKDQNQKIIGIQNLSIHAGATTFMFMLYKHLKKNYSVKCIEMFNQDTIYFRNPDFLFASSKEELIIRIKNSANTDVILIDLNNLEETNLCDEILYLLEPGIITLNKAIKKNPNLKELIKNNKLILNKSVIKDGDVRNLEYEIKFKIFFNMPSINDRVNSLIYFDEFIKQLGFKAN